MNNTERLRYLELIAIAKSDVMLASEFDELLGLQKKLSKQFRVRPLRYNLDIKRKGKRKMDIDGFYEDYWMPVCMRCENEITWCDCDKHND